MPISLQVRPTFEWPAVYLHGDPEEVEEALTLGATLQNFLRVQKSTDEVRRALESKDAEWTAKFRTEQSRREAAQAEAAEAAKLRSALESDLVSLRQAMEAAKSEARKQEREATLLETEERLRKAQHAVDAANSRVQFTEERSAAIEQQKAADIAAAVQQTRTLMQQVVAIREEQTQQAQGSLKALQEAYNRQTEELRALNEFLRRRVMTAKTKGNEYENEFRDLLYRAYGTSEFFRLEETNRNGVGHAGDFRTRFGNTDWVLWEVKNYDKPVPRQEAEKFQRDMLENREIRIGVMVSRGTEITGKTGTGDRCVEFLEGRLLIYLSRFEAMGDDHQILQSLLPLFRIWWRLAADEEETAHVEETIRELEQVVGNLTKRRLEWRVHRSRMEESLRWMTELVEEAEDQVQAVLKRIQGAGVSNTVLSEIPEGIFRPSHMDEKIQKTICTILEDYRCCVGAEVRLADMAEVFSERRKVSKDCARKYILAALLDTAVHTAPGKATVVRGVSRIIL